VITEHVELDDRQRPAWTVDELVVSVGAADATSALREAGFALVVVTNQPDIARGEVTADRVAAVNERLRRSVAVDAVYVCPHDGTDGCDCRKPQPGMLVQAAVDLDLDLERSWLVGDRWVDIAAGRAAGVRTVLVERAGSYDPTSAGGPPPDLVPDVVVADIASAAAAIIRSTN
jgi:D-glycero-D-manno-heptose 1,7-bisphosphate phosphatase